MGNSNTDLVAKTAFRSASTSYVSFILPVPPNKYLTGITDDFEAILGIGSTFGNALGAAFTTTEDRKINATNSEIVGKVMSADGSKPIYFLLKTLIPITSGEQVTYRVKVGKPQAFLKIPIPEPVEIVKVVDSEMNEYFETNRLSQESVYSSIIDPSRMDKKISSIVKRKPVPRRFVVERTPEKTFLVFGNSPSEDDAIVHPGKLTMHRTSRKNFSNFFDPMKILTSDKLGVAPQNTTLEITYRRNTARSANSAVGTVTEVRDVNLSFKSEHLMKTSDLNYIRSNLEVYNEEPINGQISMPTTEELKRRLLPMQASMGRAVTKQDYVASVYSMPASFGAIKRAAVVRDNNDLRRNLNIYLMAEGADGNFEKPSSLLKENVKTWLNSVRMISDSIDLFDANIINFSIELNIMSKTGKNNPSLMAKIKSTLYQKLKANPPDIGEPFFISEISKALEAIPEIQSVPRENGIIVKSIVGERYTDYYYDVQANTDPAGSYIYIPENSIWEIKYIDDISGIIR